MANCHWIINMSFRLPIRVYIEDTDHGGIVYHAQYLHFLERARTEFLRSLGFDKHALHDEKTIVVIHSLSIQYIRAAKLDQLLDVDVVVKSVSNASLIFQQQIYYQGELLVDAEVKLAFLDRYSERATRVPSTIALALKPYIVNSVESQPSE